MIGTSLTVQLGGWVFLIFSGYPSLLSDDAVRALLGASLLLTAVAHSWYGQLTRAFWMVRPAPVLAGCPGTANAMFQLSALFCIVSALFVLNIIPSWVNGNGVALGVLWLLDAAVLVVACRVIATCRSYGCFRALQAPPKTSAGPEAGSASIATGSPAGIECASSADGVQMTQVTPGNTLSTSTREPGQPPLPQLRTRSAGILLSL